MIHLQEMVKYGPETKTVTLSERVPHFISTPCDLTVTYHVEAGQGCYLIHLHVIGELSIQCQRCLDEFNYPYDNRTVIAVCREEFRAEQLLDQYECIVSPQLQVELEELIVDELHLYAPQFHVEITECNDEINQFFTKKNE